METDIIRKSKLKCSEENKYLRAIPTESSRQMRGAGKTLWEYILEQPAECYRLVGLDGMTSVICQGYKKQEAAFVPDEAGDVNHR